MNIATEVTRYLFYSASTLVALHVTRTVHLGARKTVPNTMMSYLFEQLSSVCVVSETIGENSCIGDNSCRGYLGPMIGDNACVGRGICANCGITIEDGQCNENIADSICNCPSTKPSIVIEDEEPMSMSPDDPELLE